MEGDVVLRVRFRHAVMQHAKSVFFDHESIYNNSRRCVLVYSRDTKRSLLVGAVRFVSRARHRLYLKSRVFFFY